MQTREENLNDLIQSLKISSDYRQRQQRLWQQETQDYASFSEVNDAAKTRTLQ
jgi:hypothetical protein